MCIHSNNNFILDFILQLVATTVLQSFLAIQVQVFLQQSPSPVTKIDSSVQCSSSTPSTAVSIGVNTGKSLLWPTVNMASTHSDMTPRGVMQAEGMNSQSTGGKKKGCHCCHHCHRYAF